MGNVHRFPTERASQHSQPRGKKQDSLEDILPDLERLVGTEGKRHGTKTDPKAVAEGERFRKAMRRLRKQVGGERGDFRSDVATKVMYRSMLAATLQLVPTAIDKYIAEKNESAAYAFSALLSKATDISDRIRGLESLEEQADYIVAQIMMPVLMTFTQNETNSLFQTKKQIEQLSLPSREAERLKKMLEEMTRERVVFMEEQSKAVNERVKAYLLGDETEKRSRKRK